MPNPVCEDWICRMIRIEKENNKITVIAEGDYREATGQFAYTLTSDEEILISYDFFLKKDISPRQTGLVFNLPEAFNTLSWERKGNWNKYPQEYIGALTGTAKALNPELPVSGIAGPDKEPAIAWNYDQTKNGSNIFRSTKENIIYAALTDNDRSLTVLSDGMQHIRTWIDNGHIKITIDSKVALLLNYSVLPDYLPKW